MIHQDVGKNNDVHQNDALRRPLIPAHSACLPVFLRRDLQKLSVENESKMCGFSCCVVVITLSVRLAVLQRVAGAEELSCARTIDLQLNWQWSASAAAGLGAYVPAAEEPYSPYTAPAVENNSCTAHHNNASRTNVAIFWTVGPGPMAKGVVQELYAALNTSGLLRAARSIVINSRDWQVAATESSASAQETEKPMVRWRELLPAHAWLPRTRAL